MILFCRAPTSNPITTANGGKIKDFVLKATLHTWKSTARRLVASVDRPMERIPTDSSKYDSKIKIRVDKSNIWILKMFLSKNIMHD